MTVADDERLSIAEILVGLSLVADLGMGLDPGESARACLLAMLLADELGAPEPADVYYTTLLAHLGCTAYAHEAAAQLGGDEIAVKAAALRTDFTRPADILRTYLPRLAPDAAPAVRARAAGTAMLRARSITDGYRRANCEVAEMTARRVGLGDGVAGGLAAIFEQPDGRGGPHGLRGDAIPLPTRIAQVAATASLFCGIGGPDLALETVRRRAGAALDAAVAERFCREGRALLARLDAADVVTAVLDAEPPPAAGARGAAIDRLCAAFADVVDLKSPYFHGHGARTAQLAAGAAERLGLDVTTVRRAALLHGIGRAAIPTGILEKRAALALHEWERVRLMPYHGERILARAGGLSPLAQVVGMHCERLDGSGYHRGASAPAIAVEARVVGTAAALAAMLEPRAHRAALTLDEASGELTAQCAAGRLDGDVVDAVLDAAGAARRERRPPARPAGLTERQVEVLRLVAEGLSNPAIAERLVISRRTAERHVQDVYGKLGVSSRAAAALFAMQHDLVR